MSTYRPRAVVIGAGIAGLSTALRLHQAGWDVLVVERTPSRRPGGYAVAFAGVGYDAAERMGILPELAKRHITPDRMDYVRPDGRTRFSAARSRACTRPPARSVPGCATYHCDLPPGVPSQRCCSAGSS